jgi:UTP--glucose-1-phosphate uridylyltransferase
MTNVRKAVFPVAGFGTRFLPATKAMPKELLPIIDKPLIQYAVEEAVAAGIDTLIFVTGRNKRAIEDHFDYNRELDSILRAKDKCDLAESISNILPKGVECIFVRQPEQLGLGHAILCAERAVANEPFAVLLADDFLMDEDQKTMPNLVTSFKNSGKTQLSIMKVIGPDISQYGVIEFEDKTNIISGLIEKPKYLEAPSDFASIGRYVLSPDIFDILRNQSFGVNNEIQLSEAINKQAKLGYVEALEFVGKRFDCGSVVGYLDAIFHCAKQKGYWN